MREIKFKIWYQNEMYSGIDADREFTLSLLTGEILENRKGCGEEPEERPILLQFTGLKDKNGKEIYEGDIIEYDRKLFEVKWGEHTTNGTEYSGYLGWYRNPISNYSFDVENLGVDGSEYEVIGNIYETPELLK
jgi:uncharacterized phage protein (TIGR01671 family)